MFNSFENIKTENLEVIFSKLDHEFYIEIKDLKDDRELAFCGDSIFANNMIRLVKKFDDFGIVVNGARVLLESA